MGHHPGGPRELAPAEPLHQPLLGDETARPQRARVDLAAGVERVERVEVDDCVLDPEGVLESLGLRRAPRQRRLAALEPGLDGATGALALHAAARRLAAASAHAAAGPARPRPGPGGGMEVVGLGRLVSSTFTRCGATWPGRFGGPPLPESLARHRRRSRRYGARPA